MKQVSITLDGKILSGECALGTTLQEFLRTQLAAAPELVSVPGGDLVSPALTLVHRCADQEFSTQVPEFLEVPAISTESLLAVSRPA